jgi:hypothetical protein
MIEMGKEYKTYSGAAVRIYTTEGQDQYQPVVGERQEASGCWSPTAWCKNGAWLPSGEKHCNDLIEVKPVRVFEGWINIYEHLETVVHQTREAADEFANPHRIACLYFRKEYKEGDGLRL